MLEYLYLICLLCLTISVPILIRGCFNLHAETGHQGGTISDRIDKVADLLDEMADLINNALPNNPDLQPITHTPQSPIMSILNAFMTRNTPSFGHASEKQEREIYEVPQNQQTQSETILDGNSPEPISG